MTCEALHRYGALVLLALMLGTPSRPADAAGFMTGLDSPDGRRISEQVAASGQGIAEITPELHLPSGSPVDWTVSGAGEPSVTSADAPSLTSALTSRLDLNVAGADLSWVCTVEVPASTLREEVRGESVLRASVPTTDLAEIPFASGPSRIDVEWAGSGSSPAQGGGLVALRSMVGDAEAPHAGFLRAKMQWRDGMVLTTAREWSGVGEDSDTRTKVGVRRRFSGTGWGVNVDLAASQFENAMAGVSLRTTGRVASVAGAAVTMAAGYERRWGVAENLEQVSFSFGADLTNALTSGLPDVLQPRLRIRGSALSVAQGRTLPALHLQEMRGKVEMGWEF